MEMDARMGSTMQDEQLAREALGLDVTVPWPHRKPGQKVSKNRFFCPSFAPNRWQPDLSPGPLHPLTEYAQAECLRS
jgi:hypothetical protein